MLFYHFIFWPFFYVSLSLSDRFELIWLNTSNSLASHKVGSLIASSNWLIYYSSFLLNARITVIINDPNNRGCRKFHQIEKDDIFDKKTYIIALFTLIYFYVLCNLLRITAHYNKSLLQHFYRAIVVKYPFSFLY